ncbi:MAG: response regulator [Sulfuricella sp.]|nr:response regulator [Sulfuricella sp.]
MNEPASSTCRVLLVEDDPADAHLVRLALRASGEPRFDTVWVTTLAEARQQLFDNPPDVILLDLSLPDSSGLDTVHLGLHAADGLPLIVLTGRDDAGFALQTLEAGAQDYLVKGRFDTDGLVRAIRYAISRGRLEQRLAETGMHLLALINAMPDVICFKDEEGRWLEANDFALKLFRLEGVDYRGKKGSELASQHDFYRETFLACEAGDEAAWQAGASQVEQAIPRPDAPPLIFDIVRMPLFHEDGRRKGLVVVGRDITTRKQAEEKLRVSNQELQRLATHLEVVREEEQKRIARELHDEMGGVLAALNINVSLLAADIPAEMPQLLADVDSLEKLVADGIRTMRQTVAALRPSLLDEVGLKIAIEKYVQEFRQNTSIECELRLPEEEPVLGATQAAAIFRIIQEALTNVVKHAAASKVNITLSEWDGMLMLTVRDNGKGFDPAIRKAKSFGLIGIQERAAMVGGKAEISSAPGKGTTVRVSLARAT